MYKVIVWGIGSFYEKIRTAILLAVAKQQIEVLAFVERENNFCPSRVESIAVLHPEDIVEIEFDYIIVASSYFKEIRQDIEKLGILTDKIINGNVLKIPYFDFERYISLKNRNVSVITENCYGGFCQHMLGLKFNSPFVNCHLMPYDYLKLLSNLDYYLKQDLEKECDNDLWENKNALLPSGSPHTFGEPVGRLADVKIFFDHALTFEEAKTDWFRRLQRFNYDDIVVMMIIENDEIAKRFELLPFKQKYGFYFKETNYNSIYCIKSWQNPKIRRDNAYIFKFFVHKLFKLEESMKIGEIDVLKLLNGELDFERKTW